MITSKKFSRLTSFEMMVRQLSKKLRVGDFSVASKFCRGKSDSSTRWLRRQAKDLFVHQALKDGYRCRSAYRLLEIDNKFHFLTPGSRVVDCGASPGSWTQVALERIKCNEGKDSRIVIAIDLIGSSHICDIREIPGSFALPFCDFTHDDVQKRIVEILPHGQANVVMSDMVPQSTGHKKLDHFKIVDLSRSALEFAKSVLSNDGVFLYKLWDGSETRELMKEISKSFSICNK